MLFRSTLTQNNHTLVVVLYVDDVLFMGNNMLLLKEKKNAFMKIVRDRNSKKLIIDQIDYAKKVVDSLSKLSRVTGHNRSHFFKPSCGHGHTMLGHLHDQ